MKNGHNSVDFQDLFFGRVGQGDPLRVPTLCRRPGADDPASLVAALRGAYGAFLVTFFWDHFSAEKETAHAKALAEAAKEAGVEHVPGARTIAPTPPPTHPNCSQERCSQSVSRVRVRMGDKPNVFQMSRLKLTVDKPFTPRHRNADAIDNISIITYKYIFACIF